MTDQEVAPSIGLVQIASLTGVSIATVSRALREVPGVAAHTRQLVQDAAIELGYPFAPGPVAPPVPAQPAPDKPRARKTRAGRVPPTPRVGIVEVAALAGVSQATVSRALQGTTNVAASTREAVLKAAEELGYVGSPIAAALARGRTNTVGVIGTWVSRWFFSAVLEGVREAISDHGYDVLVYAVGVHPDSALQAHIPSVSKRVDGVLRINVPVELSPPSTHDLRMPMVTVGSPIPGINGVQVDDDQVGYLATRHLLDLGHRHIAFVGLDPADVYGFRSAADRHRGYSRAIGEAGLAVDPALVKTTGFAVEAGEAAVAELLADVDGNAGALPTAIVAVSDEVAMGIMYAARCRGIDVPRDLSVIGVDDHDLAYLFDLTTVGQPVREQGRVAATMLLDQISRLDQAEPRLVPSYPELIQRRTTARPRG